MLISQNADWEEINAPYQKGNRTSAGCFSARHTCEYACHWHDKAANKENSMHQQQIFEPLICGAVRLKGKPDEKGGKSHHPVSEQIIVEKQAAPLIVQQPDGLLRQRLLADAGRLREIYQKDQRGIDCRKNHSYICCYLPFIAAFVLKTSGHHNIADGQKHAHKIGAKREIDDHAERKKKNRCGNNGCANFRYWLVQIHHLLCSLRHIEC